MPSFSDYFDFKKPGNIVAAIGSGGLANAGAGAWNALHDATTVPGQPSAGSGPPANPSQFVRDPTTGLYYDPTSGKTFTDPQGLHGVNNPNVAQQVAMNIQRANAIFAQLPGAQQQQQQGFAGQTALANDLRGVIDGSGGPSVAQYQLGAGVNDISANANAMAAGHTGENAALAHIQAMRSASDAQAKANQDAALVRAQETAAARTQLGTVLGQQTNEGQANVNTTLGSAHDFSKDAGDLQEKSQELTEKTAESNAKANKEWWDSGSHFVSSLY